MKKILQSTVLFFGSFLLAGKTNAQLASDTPAMTPAQIATLIKEKTAATTVVAIPANVSATTVKPVVPRKRPALSDRGVIMPVNASEATKPAPAEPVPVKTPEAKMPVVPVQDEKAKIKE